MMSIVYRASSLFLAPALAFAFLGLVAGCKDSGHSLGNSRIPDAGSADGAVPTGGTTGTGGSSVTTPTGGVPGGGGGSTAGGGSTGTGGAAGGVGGTSTPRDAGSLGGDAASPPPVDSGSDAVSDGQVDTSGSCSLPEGCTDAAGSLDANSACPALPPSSGSQCTGQAVCFYDACPSAGRTQATCTAGTWVIEVGACGEVSCQGSYGVGSTCSSGEVCLVKIGGALIISCMANPCGTGPVSPDCSDFTTGCTPMFSTASGVTYYCYTCTSGTCA
jgi:hypothetical protein